MNKLGFGLNLRLSAQKKKQEPPRPPPFGFNDEDDDDVERDISRQASKNKSLKDVSQCPFGFDFFVMLFLLARLVF
jgi:coiled-coil domain-containing protein 55